MEVLLAVSFVATMLLVIEGFWILYTTRAPANADEVITTPARGPKKKLCIIFPSYNDYVELDKWIKWAEGEDVKFIIQVDGGKKNDKWKDKATMLTRKSREGFKAGAVNNALEWLVAQKENFDYVLVFDADHIPYNNSVKEIYGYLNKEIIQFFWLDGLPLDSMLNWLTFSSRYYSNWNLYNRAYTNLTGSSIAIRYDLIKEDKLRFPHTITEDHALTLYTLQLRKLKVTVMPYVLSIGVAPSGLGAYVKQQTRWAEGTIRDARVYFWKVLMNDEIPFGGKIDFLLHVNLYLQGVWLIITLVLLISGLGFSIWLIPLILFQAVAYLKMMSKAPKVYWAAYFVMNYFMAVVQLYALLRAFLVEKAVFQVTSK